MLEMELVSENTAIGASHTGLIPFISGQGVWIPFYTKFSNPFFFPNISFNESVNGYCFNTDRMDNCMTASSMPIKTPN